MRFILLALVAFTAPRLLADSDGAVPGRARPTTMHWSFVPPARPPIPAVKNAAWLRSPIDAFVLARLEKEGLTPAPEADRPTLIRRLALDLTGLPPSPEEVERLRRRPVTRGL